MAAVLLGGPGAVASHRSAGAALGILRSAPGRPEVTVSRERRQCRPVRFHYGRIAPDEMTTVRGVPLSSVSRTIFDLAGELSPARVAAAMAEAEVQRLTDTVSLHDLIERYPRRRGARTVKAILRDGRIGASRTRSEIEAVLLEFLDGIGLPRPEMNLWLCVKARWIEVDCVWREQRLLAELDGVAAHLTTSAFERDHARDRALAVAKWRTIRITWRQLQYERRALEADLRTLLTS
jgi:hypothetical protein